MKLSGNTTIKSLLTMVKKCKTDASITALRCDLQDVLMGSSALHFKLFNEESRIHQDGVPFARFSMTRVFSDRYVYEITPNIQDGGIVIFGCLYHMRDGLGIGSKDYEPVEGWDNEMPFSPEDKLKTVIARIINKMLAAHTKLIQDVGVPARIAKNAAEDSWGGPLFAEQ